MAFLSERDHNNTLPAPGRDPILLIYEKIIYYSLDHLEIIQKIIQ